MTGGDLGYFRPRGLTEALSFLREHGNETTLLAGGTDVMVDLRSGKLKTRCLVDVSRLEELKGIAISEEGISLGAGVTISEIQGSETLRHLAPALWKASVRFASPQIRNVATLGGNVAHCAPCGDMVPPLIIHEARAVLISSEGERQVPVESLAAGPYRSAIRTGEILTRFHLNPLRGSFSDFQKIGRRKELAISRVSMAVMADQDLSGKITFIRLALGSSTPTPQRMEEVESLLLGKAPDEGGLWEAGRVLSSRMIAISGRRPSTLYKENAVQGLFMRLLYPMVVYGKGL
jgi:CO/xanthine dehydrogenase FAD-binding subunit